MYMTPWSVGVYIKEGMPHEKAVEIIIQGKGTHFDPDMVDAFMDITDEFNQIAKRYEDT